MANKLELDVDQLNMLLREQGKMIVPLTSLYEWRRNPNCNIMGYTLV